MNSVEHIAASRDLCNAILDYIDTLVHTCSCGRTYTAQQWRALPCIGFMDDGDGGQIELRNCGCGSTCAIPVRR